MAEYWLAVFTPQVGAVSETFIRRHVNELVPKRTVTITCQVGDPARSDWSFDGPMLVLDHIQPVHFTREAGWKFTSQHIAHIKRFLLKHKVRVVLGEYLDVSLPLLEIALELEIPFWGHAHGYDISMRLRECKMRKAYRHYNNAAGIIVGCEWARERLKRLGLTDVGIHIIPCGVDVPEQAVIRGQMKRIRCLAVGRLVEKKGPLFTLDAFRRVLKVCPDLRLDYVGSGELLPAAGKYIRDCNLEEHVVLWGSKPHGDVKKLMRSTDVFLQHSITDPVTGDEEMMPLSILEAMAYNLPVVSTRHAGIPEAVEDGVTGYLVDEGDTIGMSIFIGKLARDQYLRNRFGYEGRQRVSRLFAWRHEHAALLRLLGHHQSS